MKCTWPAIDHSLLSPSGHMSKRARKAADKREFERLFRGCSPLNPPVHQPLPRERDLRWAAELEALAERGMSPRKHRKAAAALRAKWS